MDNSTKSSEGDTRMCPFCKDTRCCHKCDGSGVRTVKKAWWLLKYQCPVCRGTGACQLCKLVETPSRTQLS